MAKFDTITIDEIIASTKMQLRITDTTTSDDYFELMANEALRHLNCLSLFKKRQCTMDIVDLKSKLPKGFQRILGLRFSSTNVSGNENCYNLVYIDRKFLNSCGCDTSAFNLANYVDSFQMQHGYIYYNSDIGATEATLAFMGLNLDEYGRLIVYEDYERAIRAYLCWMFTQAYPEDFKEATTERYGRTWKAQKAFLKGEDVQEDFRQNKYEIGKIFNGLLVSDFVNL